MPEVWLRNLPVTTDPLRHLLLCTLQQTQEDTRIQTEALTDAQVWQRPHGLTPIGFHIRHIAESIDRLLTYAEGNNLDDAQLATLKSELLEHLPLHALLTILDQRLNQARSRIAALNHEQFHHPRHIGRARIEVPLGTLLAHIAEHTQRHLGQITTTVKVLQSSFQSHMD